ncbi:MAG: phytanoyl-CoA dioxygenase family protein [Pacificimonas sp.]
MDIPALEEHGAVRVTSALTPATSQRLWSDLPVLGGSQVPGRRLTTLGAARPLFHPAGAIGRFAAAVLGHVARPVRAVLFDKRGDLNWTLGWHQDRTIVVKARQDCPGFGNWTIKSGLLQVEPPFEIIEQMLTMRIHLDDVDADNAPLLVLPGSHRAGRLTADDVTQMTETLTPLTCLAQTGDIWIYRTAVVHRSAAVSRAGDRRRRVLQVDYSAEELPSQLEWRGL